MIIEYGKQYTYDKKANSGLGFEYFGKIKFNGQENELTLILEELSKNYLIHQYNHNKYGEHDLFYWSNDNHTRYFDLSINDKKFNQSELYAIQKDILYLLENKLNNLNVDVYIEKGYVIDSNKVEEFLFNYEVDLNDLQLDKFKVIDLETISRIDISEKAKSRFNELNTQFLEMVKGKKAIINNDLEGAFKPFADRVVFFKKRVRKSYYEIQLNKLSSIQFI